MMRMSTASSPSDQTVLIVTVIVFLMMIRVASAAGSSSQPVTAVLIRVDQSGKGDYKTIQAAVDSVPSGNSVRVFILVMPGTYREKVMIPADKPNITLSGKNAKTTIITWSEQWTAGDSATLTVRASDFVGRYLTIQNTLGSRAQALAVRVAGDRAAFFACRMLSYQDTLLDEAGRHYYTNCYIQGATDIICGNAQSLFQKCHIHSISEGGGAITAQKRNKATEGTGFMFLQCKLTGTSKGKVILGRPWGPYSRVVFAHTYMSAVVMPSGWDDWGVPSNQRTAFYAQYRCYGRGADTSGRVGWARKLSTEQAGKLINQFKIDCKRWLPPLPTRFRKP